MANFLRFAAAFEIGADMLKIIFIRHGQTAGNLRHNYIGRTDESLCAEGRANLQQKIADGFYPPADALFGSPMLRCQETAALIYPKLRLQRIADLRECDFGEFENLNYQDLNGNPAYQQWLDSKGTLPFPGGESREQFAARCRRGFKYALAQASLLDKLQSIAFVVHGGTIMALLASYAEGEYYNYMCANGEGFSCFWQDGRLTGIMAL